MKPDIEQFAAHTVILGGGFDAGRSRNGANSWSGGVCHRSHRPCLGDRLFAPVLRLRRHSRLFGMAEQPKKS